MLPQLLLNTIVSFSLTFLIGVGYVLVIEITKINYFIQGAIVSFLAYISWFLFSFSNLSWFLICFINLLLGVLINVSLFRLIFKRFYDQKSSFSLMFLVSLSLVVILENLIQIIFGANVKVLKLEFANQSINLFDTNTTLSQFVLVTVSLISISSLYWLMYKSFLGKKWISLSQNRKLFQSLGYNLNQNIVIVFGLSGFLAALAGICLSLERSLTPQIGTNLFLTAFVAASLANYELKYFWFWCIIVAFLKTISIWFLPSGWSDGIVFGLLGVWIVGKQSVLIPVMLSKAKHLSKSLI